MASPTAPITHLALLVDALVLKIFNLCLEAYEVINADDAAFAGSKKLLVSLVIRIVLQSLPEGGWMHPDYLTFLTQASFYWEEKLIKKFHGKIPKYRYILYRISVL